MIEASQNKQGRNKRWRRWGWLTLLGIIILFTSYGIFVEPSWNEVKQVDVTLKNLPPAFKGFRIVQLSDIHFGSLFSDSRLRKVVQEVNQLQPDIVVLTGDFLSDKYDTDTVSQPDILKSLTAILQEIKPRKGIYAIWGNHDRADRVELNSHFTRAGITILCNEATFIEKDSQRLCLIGIDDVWRTFVNPEQALWKVKKNDCVIALVHKPDFAAQMAAYPVALQLSGHTHGGQIQFPGTGLIRHRFVDLTYRDGLFQIGKMQLYVNRGVGLTGLPMRIGSRPEITCITLH